MGNRKAQRTGEEKGMNIAREQSMKTFEDLYAEPPPYSSRPPSTHKSTPNTDAGGAPSRSLPEPEELNFQPSPLEIPTPAECIAHLKLLHAFAKLRHDIGNHDGLFGISMEKMETSEQHSSKHPLTNGSQQPGGVHEQDAARAAVEAHAPETATNYDAALAERIRDKRWSVFVTKAVARFEKWWELMSGMSTWYRPIRLDDFETNDLGPYTVGRFPTTGDGYEDGSNFYLPPLDVLMVWHAYMLNPRTYLEDSVRYTRQTLWRTSFPWELIYKSIDNETLEYRPEDRLSFQQTTGYDWDLVRDEGLAKIKCPKCVITNQIPWTQPPITLGPEALEAYLANDMGFSGPQLQHPCSNCELIITHENLRVGKFCNDAQDLLSFQRPLAGTILNIWGEPAGTIRGKKLGTHGAFFPNRVIEILPDLKPVELREQMNRLTVEMLKVKFTDLMKNRPDITLVNAQQKIPPIICKSSRIAVRKVLSHYWDNSSVFGIDLVGAVLRQGTFVQKMHKLDWLHSPNVMSTVQRLIVKYHRFVRLAADYPEKTVVPTLDIDLAWHTHQLTPKTYYTYTLAETKKFLNHDDKIPESNLHTSFQWTSQAYEKKYNQPYAECSCWYCECTREPLRSSFLSKLSTTKLSIAKLDEKNFPKNPHMGPHVSAHSAVTLASPEQRRKELEDLDLTYAKVLKRYNKQKAAEAPRKDNNDAYMYGAYGYPMYYPMPIYAPYYAAPGTCGHANTSGGGSCAAGTCSDSTSLGACAGGDGTPSCLASCGGAGGAGGGCGSCGGGDGGGGGGCGGGGGGCGGGS